MPPTFQEMVKEVRKWLKQAKDIVDANSLPFDQATKDDLASKLDNAGSDIDTILDPGTLPSLSPTSAGSVDTSVPSTPLATCAQAAWQGADEAVTESEGNNDQDYIGDRLRTIKSHILPGYRSQAGIASS